MDLDARFMKRAICIALVTIWLGTVTIHCSLIYNIIIATTIRIANLTNLQILGIKILATNTIRFSDCHETRLPIWRLVRLALRIVVVAICIALVAI